MSQLNVDTIKSRTGGAPTLSNGVVVGAAATFSGNVSIAGTITYEDVTNVDSIGIITARNGAIIKAGTATTALIVEGDARVTGILTVGSSSITLNGSTDQINVGSGLTLSSSGILAGVITATSFAGSLTGTASTATAASTAYGLTGTPNLNVGIVTTNNTLNVSNSNITSIKTASFNSQNTIATTSGSITVDWTVAQNQKQNEPTGTITYTFTAPPGPCHLQLLVDSDGSSTAQTFNWPGTLIWLGTTWTATNNKKAIINFWYDGSNYFAIGTNQA